MVVRVWWNAAWICRFECTRTVITHPTASPPSPETSGLDRARARVVVHGRSRVARGPFWFDLLRRVASPSQPSGNDSRMLSGTWRESALSTRSQGPPPRVLNGSYQAM